LYSQFNLPTDVTIDININSTLNQNINGAEILALGNNPQKGTLVPQTFTDINNTIPDNDAVSGYVISGYPPCKVALTNSFYSEVWQLANGQTLC
jgi:hypothetical protein